MGGGIPGQIFFYYKIVSHGYKEKPKKTIFAIRAKFTRWGPNLRKRWRCRRKLFLVCAIASKRLNIFVRKFYIIFIYQRPRMSSEMGIATFKMADWAAIFNFCGVFFLKISIFFFFNFLFIYQKPSMSSKMGIATLKMADWRPF